MTFADVCDFALGLPGVAAATSYGTPALKVKGKLVARLREDGDTLVVTGIAADERDMLVEGFPETYYVTDHYRPYPTILVRLSKADPLAVHRLLERRWRSLAPKRLLAVRSS